jgi:hypothetical protein
MADKELREARNERNESSIAKSSGIGIREQQVSLAKKDFSAYPAGLTVAMEVRVRSWTELALRNDPLNARAYRILGQLSDRSLESETTRRLMRGAVERSLHESIAVYWMMQRSFVEGNFRNAVRYGDVLLRTRPQLLNSVVPIFGEVAEAGEGGGELKAFLAKTPPWRSDFLNSFPSSITDARTPLDFFLSLKDSTVPPSSAELRGYLNFLVRHKFYELAYYTWFQFLSPEEQRMAKLLFNGGFELQPSGLPFDWTLSKGSGSTIKIAARPDAKGGQALVMQFGPGRVEFPGVSQLLFLPPGRYHFQGEYKIEMISALGLQWRITCASGAKQLIGESDSLSGIDPRWREFQVSFDVPPTECPAQNLRLVSGARSASEKFMSGSAWYDNLEIMRSDKTTEEEAIMQ